MRKKRAKTMTPDQNSRKQMRSARQTPLQGRRMGTEFSEGFERPFKVLPDASLKVVFE